MSDPNQPPPYPGSEYPPPPPYGQQPAYGVPQYPTGPSYQQYAAPPPSPYTHWGYRVGAHLLDVLLLVPAYATTSIGLEIADDPGLSDTAQNTGGLVALFSAAALFGFWVWNQVIRQGRTGSSLGKQWVGIAVVSDGSGLPIGGWNTFGRSLLHILDLLPCGVGYLWPLWDDKRQTFADKIMRTVVLRRAPGQSVYPPYQPPAYPPTYGPPQG